MDKRKYIKPEMDILTFDIRDSILKNASWTVDGNKKGDIKEGPGEGGEDLELDSRKNDSGWDFEW